MNKSQFQRCKQARDLLHEVQLELRRSPSPALADPLFRLCAKLWETIFPYRPEAKFGRTQ